MFYIQISRLPKGQPVSQTHFTVIGYGPEYTKQTAMEFAADMQFSNLQQFGENFLEQRVQAYRMPLDILERVSKCLLSSA